MPLNLRRPEPFDYSNDLTAGRRDLQADAHRFFGMLFPAGSTLLDVGSGQGWIKGRVPYPTTTYDIDRRLGPPPEGCGWVDVAGGEPPAGPFDLVTAFDAIEHVEDDLGFLRSLADRAQRAVFVTTPNWFVTRCNEAAGGSTHHWREYTVNELWCLGTRVWPEGRVLILAYYKDAAGGWWEFHRKAVPEHHRRRHGLLWFPSGDDFGDHERLVAQVTAGAQPTRTPG